MDPGDELEAAWAGNSVVPIPNHGLEEGEACGLLMDVPLGLRIPCTLGDMQLL